MHRRLRSVLIALAVSAGISASPSPAAAAEKISIGTIAPKGSMWGKVFTAWTEAVHKKSDGKLELTVFYNGTQGDDGAMVGKMKAGQLDGAAVTSLGLGKIHKPILALQIPGLFRNWESLDRAREAMKGEFEKGAEGEGFYIAGWGDLGRIHAMSRGFAVRRPEDLRGKRVLTFQNDVLGPTIYQLIPGATPVPMSIPEILPALRTKSLDVLSAPSLGAEQLQWAPHLDHIGSESTIMAIGGFVWSKNRLDKLPADLRAILVDTGSAASAALKKRIRAEDEAAYARLASKMTVVKLSDADREAWKVVFKKAAERLAQGTFDPALVDRLAKLSAQSTP